MRLNHDYDNYTALPGGESEMIRKGCCLIRLLILALVLAAIYFYTQMVSNRIIPEVKGIATDYAHTLKDAEKER